MKAFPILFKDSDGVYFNEGMDLRDYFAAKAMQANLTAISDFPDEHWRMELALDSYEMADAMLEAREKTK